MKRSMGASISSGLPQPAGASSSKGERNAVAIELRANLRSRRGLSARRRPNRADGGWNARRARSRAVKYARKTSRTWSAKRIVALRLVQRNMYSRRCDRRCAAELRQVFGARERRPAGSASEGSGGCWERKPELEVPATTPADEDFRRAFACRRRRRHGFSCALTRQAHPRFDAGWRTKR